MADIDKELNDIKNAVYGREVRGSIHDGIKKINEEVEDNTETSEQAKQQVENIQEQVDNLVVSGDSSVEAAQARVDKDNHNYGTLKERLDAEQENVEEVDQRLTTQLADEAQVRMVESSIERKQFNYLPRNEPGNEETLLISWTDDDGFVEVYDRFKQILEQYNIPITSAIITSKIGTDDSKYLNYEQIYELMDLGMEFLSHSHAHDVNHMLSDMTEGEVDEDFRLSKEVIKHIGANDRGIILPFARNNYIIQKMGRKHFDYVIGTGADIESNEPFYPAQYSNYYIRRTRTEFGLEHVKQKIDEAKASGKAWVVLSSHIYDEIYTQEFIKEIVVYANSLGFKWVTTQEGYETFGNIAQFGMMENRLMDYAQSATRIGADGTIVSDVLGKVRRTGDREVGFNTPLSYFLNDTISVTKIRQVDNDGFPGVSGILYTYKLDEDVFAYQEYVTSRNRNVYRRHWDEDNDEWTDFDRINVVRYTKGNHFTANDVPSDETSNKITYTAIHGSNASEFPTGGSGTLVFNHYTSSSFVYQEYHLFRSVKKYKRYWHENDNEWGPWRLTEDVVVTHRVPVNNMTSDKMPSDYEEGITETYITTQANDSGLPESSGNLHTYKFDGGIGRTYQEFRGYSSFNKYIRYERGDGQWSDWKRYVLESV